MHFGICGGLELAFIAAQAGFDYFEWTVGDFLQPRDGRDAFQNALKRVKNAPLPCPVLNCFIPSDLKITGPEACLAILEKYVATVFQRAESAGVKLIVFGSGGARRVPDGFSRAKAWDQIVSFCRMAAPLAEEHGLSLVVEPLHRRECNILTSAGEAAALVREVAHPALGLLVDSYHWFEEGDSPADIVENGRLLRHVHVATSPNRLAPGAETCDLTVFFTALHQAGYDQRVSFEGSLRDPHLELPSALAVMRELAG